MGKVTILDRYIFKELALVFMLSLGGLTGILLLEKIHFLSDLIFNKGVSLKETLLLLLYISPTFLSITIPLSMLLACIMGFSRLSGESELIAMKACGISLYRLMVPAFFLALLGFLISSIIAIELQHRGNLLLKEMIFDILRSRVDVQFKERVFNNNLDRMTIYIDKKTDNSPLMKGVFIETAATPHKFRIIHAAEGMVVPVDDSVVLHLINGTIHESGGEREAYQLLKFKEYDLKINFRKSEKKGGENSKGPKEMSLTELNREIETRKKKGLDTNPLKVEVHSKFALPFSCIAFALLGVPLGIRVNRSGKGASLGVGIIIMLFNYMLLIAGISMGSKGALPPALSMWIPNFITLGLALYILRKSAREESPINVKSVQKMFSLWGKFRRAPEKRSDRR